MSEVSSSSAPGGGWGKMAPRLSFASLELSLPLEGLSLPPRGCRPAPRRAIHCPRNDAGGCPHSRSSFPGCRPCRRFFRSGRSVLFRFTIRRAFCGNVRLPHPWSSSSSSSSLILIGIIRRVGFFRAGGVLSAFLFVRRWGYRRRRYRHRFLTAGIASGSRWSRIL